MAMSRSYLKGMGLTDEQISAIIEAHSETVESLKAQRDDYKKAADAASEELEGIKAKGGEWQARYESEHSAFEAYKTQADAKASLQAKENAYRKLLLDAGVSEKRLDSVMKVSDLTSITLSEDGSIAGADALTESIKTEWSDFIVQTDVSGADTPTPPTNGGGGGTAKEIPIIF